MAHCDFQFLNFITAVRSGTLFSDLPAFRRLQMLEFAAVWPANRSERMRNASGRRTSPAGVLWACRGECGKWSGTFGRHRTAHRSATSGRSPSTLAAHFICSHRRLLGQLPAVAGLIASEDDHSNDYHSSCDVFMVRPVGTNCCPASSAGPTSLLQVITRRADYFMILIFIICCFRQSIAYRLVDVSNGNAPK